MTTELNVFLGDDLVGYLGLKTDRSLQFHYDESWTQRSDAIPLSIRLPVQNKIFDDSETRPFFENLLPESLQRKILAQEFKISEKNIFSLLENIGGECAGALSLFPKISSVEGEPNVNKIISHKKLARLIQELPTHPLLASRSLRLSLAGVQEKLLIHIKNKKLYLPTKQQPSTHILKPKISHFQYTVINEFFCMSLARFLDISVPNVELMRIDQPLYLVERFDRILDASGKLKRLHQEDFCQAKGCLSEQKYESEGGPSLKDCFELLQNNSIQPVIDIHKLIQWVIFNYLVGNADAHGKNIAFLLTQDGPRLAPFYDILSTEIYPRLSEKFAMKIGGENRGNWIRKRHWERFSESIGVNFNLIKIILEKLMEDYHNSNKSISELVEKLERAEQDLCQLILKKIEKRLQQIKMIL